MRPSAVKWFLGAVLVLAVIAGHEAVAAPKPADPQPPESARSYYDRATSAFGLADYTRAAELYEKAFELRADAALLYNAAQAHRLAGHRERALELYRNYSRLFPDSKQAPDARRHMNELQGAPAASDNALPLGSADTAVPDAVGDEPARNRTGATTAPPPANPALTAPPPIGAGPTAAGADLTKPAGDSGSADAAAGPKRSRTWIWIVVGGAAVVAGVTTVALLGGKTHDPTPSLGTVGEMSAP